jgi:DNA-binding response OmpR family regulator
VDDPLHTPPVFRVLVADDEPHIRRLLTTILSKSGYLVDEADSGSAALELWHAAQTYDAVLLDLMMPGATGLEVLEVIRAGEHGIHTPVIILTAKGQDADRDAAFAAGADDFMTKPFSPKKLVARLHEILHNR